MLITFLEDLKESLFNHYNCSHPSLEVVVYLFLSLKGRQSSILWSVLCRFHWLYHCYHSLSVIAICCHSLYYSLPLFITCCTTRCHSLSFAVTRCIARCHSLSVVAPLVVTRCHSLSLVVTRCTTRLSFYKRSKKIGCCLIVHIKEWSSLIYKMSAWSEPHECDASNANATRVRHECDTSATRSTRVRHEWKTFDFDNCTSKNIFSHSYIYYMASEEL